MKNKYFFFLIFLFLAPIIAYGQSDLFEIRTPNVMIIFDTSSSMNMNVNGISVPSGNVCVDTFGRLQPNVINDPSDDGNPPCVLPYSLYNFEGGANHPRSKLYQAKLALGDVLKGLENMNLGFATYGQRKQEKWRGYFKKCKSAQIEKKWCEKRYWRWRQIVNTVDGPRTANDFSPDSFKDAWGFTRTGVSKDSRFYRTISLYDKPASSIPPHSNLKTKSFNWWYTVTNIELDKPYANEYGVNRYIYTYVSDPLTYDSYEETQPLKSIDPCGSCGPDKEGNPFPVTWPDGANPPWETYFKNDSRGFPYKDEYDKPFGNNPGKNNWWDCKTQSQPAKPVCWDPDVPVFDYGWRTYTGTKASVCDNTKDQADGWRYVSNCHDVSEYYYPIGSAPALPYINDDPPSRPHTWSYFHIESDKWPESIQQKPSRYPAPTANPGDKDNNFFFINFPEVDDSSNDYKVKKEILKWLDLVPVKNPQTGLWHTKLPLKTDSITSNTIESFSTPLADSLSQAKKYFNDYIFNYKGGDAASISNCRGNYVILMTDGLESARLKGDGTPDYDAPAKAARELFELVIKENKFCGVKTFVIGFGAGLKGNKPEVLNDIANKGETGSAYFAENLSQLQEAFKKIFQIIGPGYSRSNPVVASIRDKIYRGYFNLPGWEGHLVAYKLNLADGSIEDTNLDGKIDEKDVIWDAGHSKAIDKSARATVYTWDKDKNPKLFVFDESSAGKLKDLINSPEEDINEDGEKNTEDAKAIIRFILNPGSDGEKYKGSRSPTWSLGDIYHSTPLIVGKPPFNIPDDLFSPKYSKFKEDQKNRPTTIYVGANDGMLHAFDEKDGKEKFAIIPKNLLGKLREIRNDHQFFVDSSPRAYDVYSKKGKAWLTVLVSGQRGGGNYYFALDVTDPNKPDKPEVLWEMTDSGMGYTWSRPEIGRVKISGEEKFVVFVGGGYSDPKEPKNDNVGNTFYILDIEDEGKILRKYDIGSKSNRVPAGATAFDKDGDGRIDGVYFGDIQGTLWKIKIDGEEDVDKWELIELFKSDGGNPIFYPPAVTKNNQGKVLVYFGQGNELDLFEKIKTYYFYEIWDKGDSGVKTWRTEGKTQLRPGEKVLAAPAISNNVVYFTTWQYTGVEDNCGAGVGRLYGLSTTRTGEIGGLAGLFYDIGGTRQEKPQEYIELGAGIPSAPVVTNGAIYVSTSLNANRIIKITIPLWGKGKLKSWREVF